LRELSALTTDPVRFEFWPRARAAEAWERWHPGRRYRRAPYAHRGWSNKRLGVAVLLVDPTETRQSILHGVAHELAHLDLRGTGITRLALRPKQDAYWTTDAAHDGHPEEQLANLVATQTLRRLGRYDGRSYDRAWWRRRVRAQQRSRGLR
jgi:hypothetical protein